MNGKHTIFGRVIKGYEVLQAIESYKTDEMDRPIEEQKIIRVRLERAAGAVEVPGVKNRSDAMVGLRIPRRNVGASEVRQWNAGK